MSGRIIPLRGEPHERIQSLLPWFVTDRLDAAERAEVEAHLTGCPDCRAEERLERRLGSEVAAMPMDVEQSWARLRARLERPASANRGWGSGGGLAAAWRGLGRILRGAPPWTLQPVHGAPPWMGWAMAGQAVLMVALLSMVWPHGGSSSTVDARYHALGAAPSPRAGNVVVMFRPDTREQDLRAALLGGQARLVDGPTAAGVYVLNVPAARRPAAVAALRRRPGVIMAEPIDAAGAR
ncbi:MAG: zf-HC2 protein [Caulobacteraceae bacterium]|nr:zf-HC2 protein [Caulobacteraceae bacterium]